MVAPAYNPTLRRLRKEDGEFESEASLGYTINSRPAGIIQQYTVSKYQTKPKINNSLKHLPTVVPQVSGTGTYHCPGVLYFTGKKKRLKS